MNTTYIIGCGGIGSWLATSLSMLIRPPHLLELVDGDKLTGENLSRQLFDGNAIGINKARALAWKLGARIAGYHEGWFSEGMRSFDYGDWLIVCADNNPARKAALRVCDRDGCSAIIAANETYSSEAYVYTYLWEDTELDPRVYYPEINTDRAGDPRAAAAGCTGDAQRDNPQLVSANFSAAALAQNLYVLWAMTKHDHETKSRLPYHYRANMASLEFFRCNQTEKGQA